VTRDGDTEQTAHWRTIPGGVELVVTGTVDHSNACDLAVDLNTLVDMAGVRLVSVNMAAVSSIDQTGIDTLVAAHHRARSAGVALVLGHLPKTLRPGLADAGALEILTG
jgi:anti-anti-sigma regulatory factor